MAQWVSIASGESSAAAWRRRRRPYEKAGNQPVSAITPSDPMAPERAGYRLRLRTHGACAG